MAVTVNIYYSGVNGNAKNLHRKSQVELQMIFVEKTVISEMNTFFSMDDEKTVFLIDSRNKAGIIRNQLIFITSPIMKKIIEFREEYDLQLSLH